MLTVTSPPADLFSVDDAKAALRITTSREDALITKYIKAATGYLDGANGVLGQCIVTRTMRLDLFEIDRITRLPLGPKCAVSEVAYYDEAGTRRTLSSGSYFVATDALGQYLKIKDAVSIPNVEDERPDAVQITYTAGFGAPADVPEQIKSAVLLVVGQLYTFREVDSMDKVYAASFGVDDLIAPYRRVF